MKTSLKYFGCRRAAGFTLLELVVVMGIIAVLATVAYPYFNRAIYRAEAAACNKNLGGIGVALQLYLADNNNTFPTLTAARSSTEDNEPALDTELKDYCKDSSVWTCKGDKEKIWQKTGTSYYWNSTLNGQNAAKLDFLGIFKQSGRIPVITDKENFHKWVGLEVNILFADGHVEKDLKFQVEGK